MTGARSRSGAAGSAVSVTSHPLWRLRVSRELPRYLVCLLSVAGVAASVRFALMPPGAGGSPAVHEPSQSPDRAAEGYAVLFARRYLTWNADEPQADVRGLETFVGPGMEASVGFQPPPHGEQRVEWAEVVQSREPSAGTHVYTVAAQTDSAGLLYLAVTVTRSATGGLALSGYPAFVGAPASAPAQVPGGRAEVSEPALLTVVGRALRNYLADAANELAADLTAYARVSLPTLALSLVSVQRVLRLPGGRSVLAQVAAQDERGAQYTLAYELEVIRAQGRWEVSAVQMDFAG